MSDRRGFDKIIGQELAKRTLIKASKEQHPSHAYLFLGLQGTGKLTTAIEFAKALNCEAPIEGNACGMCVLCRSIEHNNFPDIRVWEPGSRTGQETTIDQMREMRDAASFAPMRGKWKVNIIEQADTLNEESANCILKLIEEPPSYLINILLYRNAANIMPTIRSRCQLVRFTQVNEAQLIQRLVEDFGVSEDESRFLAAYSQGCPGRAIGLIGNDAFFSRRNAIIEIASEAVSGNSWAALKLAEILRKGNGKAVKEATVDEDEEGDDISASESITTTPATGKKMSARDSLIESLDILAVWYRDLLAISTQGPHAAIVNIDKREDLEIQARQYNDPNRLAKKIQAILQTKRAILGNANAQLAAEALMMKLIDN